MTERTFAEILLWILATIFILRILAEVAFKIINHILFLQYVKQTEPLQFMAKIISVEKITWRLYRIKVLKTTEPYMVIEGKDIRIYCFVVEKEDHFFAGKRTDIPLNGTWHYMELRPAVVLMERQFENIYSLDFKTISSY